MSQQEGVIKFDLGFHPGADRCRRWRWQSSTPGGASSFCSGWSAATRSATTGSVTATSACACRPIPLPPMERPFVISGTQTGALAELAAEHYAVVRSCDPQRNRVVAAGPLRPSSEALTHGALYALDPALRCVLHVHSPLLWRHAVHLELPLTDPAAAYGTPAMAAEVARLYAEPAVRAGGIFAMGGHEDGLVAFGAGAEAAATALLHWLARALASGG